MPPGGKLDLAGNANAVTAITVAVAGVLAAAFALVMLLLAVFCGAVIKSYLLVYVADGTYIDGHASFWSTGVQGRYLIPYCLAGLLALMPYVLSAGALYGLFSLERIATFYYRW